jgi:hypothetical protein
MQLAGAGADALLAEEGRYLLAQSLRLGVIAAG